MVDEHISDRKIETESVSLGFFIETIEYVLPRILRSEIDSKHMFQFLIPFISNRFQNILSGEQCDFIYKYVNLYIKCMVEGDYLEIFM